MKTLRFSFKNGNSSSGRLSFLGRAIVLLGLFGGCAGPATPLGSIWATRVSEVSKEVSPDEPPTVTEGPSGVKIEFLPARQILHGAKPFIIHIEDLAGIDSEPKLEIRYDGIDVTPSFLRQSQFLPSASHTHLDLKIPVVRLSPAFDHRIEVSYFNSSGQVAVANYGAPVCRVFDNRLVKHTDEFDPDQSLLDSIGQLSEDAQINPSLVTGLIAQESSFDSHSVSWAKAMGLTQMTPIAENELVDNSSEYHAQFQNWPRYEGLDRLPASLVKMFVLTGKINESNDWRIDKKMSVQGGIAYLRLLEKHWGSPELKARFDEVERTKLILASYNSGSARVQLALRNYGKNWINAPELKEARRYVERIFSYCDFFSQDVPKEFEDLMTNNGSEYEDET